MDTELAVMAMALIWMASRYPHLSRSGKPTSCAMTAPKLQTQQKMNVASMICRAGHQWAIHKAIPTQRGALCQHRHWQSLQVLHSLQMRALTLESL